MAKTILNNNYLMMQACTINIPYLTSGHCHNADVNVCSSAVLDSVLRLYFIYSWLISSIQRMWPVFIALGCLYACAKLPHIVKVSRYLLVKHCFSIKCNIFLFTALDYVLFHSFSAANDFFFC